MVSPGSSQHKDVSPSDSEATRVGSGDDEEEAQAPTAENWDEETCVNSGPDEPLLPARRRVARAPRNHDYDHDLEFQESLFATAALVGLVVGTIVLPMLSILFSVWLVRTQGYFRAVVVLPAYGVGLSLGLWAVACFFWTVFRFLWAGLRFLCWAYNGLHLADRALLCLVGGSALILKAIKAYKI